MRNGPSLLSKELRPVNKEPTHPNNTKQLLAMNVDTETMSCEHEVMSLETETMTGCVTVIVGSLAEMLRYFRTRVGEDKKYWQTDQSTGKYVREAVNNYCKACRSNCVISEATCKLLIFKLMMLF
jgi:predicted transcriptional regulator